MLSARSVLARLPAHVLNGIGVSLGVALVYGAGYALFGPGAALGASTGAVYASLADVPNAPARTFVRVLTAALIGVAVCALVAGLRPHAAAVAAAIVVIGFLSAMTLAWGPRAGPISFVGIMTFVFTMAAPPPPDARALLRIVTLVAFGAFTYLGWAVLVARLLAARYRALALAAVYATLGELLRARASALVATDPAPGAPGGRWIDAESQLDERLQAARDALFAAHRGPHLSLQIALLLYIIDLREAVLLNQLDLELLGEDAPGRALRSRLAARYEAMAAALQPMQDAVRRGRFPVALPAAALPELQAEQSFDEADPRGRLLHVLYDRARHVQASLERMRVLIEGAPAVVTLSHEELQLFVSLEGWPLSVVRRHLRLRSPILRHALRAGTALGVAYGLALALPWSSHPHWLVLSVAVVLRGSLDQTVARRNLRVAGTVAGCLIVLAIAQLATPWLSTVVYLGATGLSHAYSVARYFVTATSATVMALLQDHLSNPAHGFAVAERLADTFIGAALAWAFSYLLPSWERYSLPRVLGRLTLALERLADQTMRFPEAGTRDLDLAVRLARREVYDALRTLAGAAQRSRAEPRSVRIAERAYSGALAHSHALMAQLAAVRLILARRGDQIERSAAEQALAEARKRVPGLLHRRLEGDAAGLDAAALEASRLPIEGPARASLPWLQRRLQLAAIEADRAGRSLQSLRETARAGA